MSEVLPPFDFPATTVGGVTIGPLTSVRTVEHVFQAFKAALCGHDAKRDRILAANKPESCKAATSRHNMKMDAGQLGRWDTLSPEVMMHAVRAKFAGAEGARTTVWFEVEMHSRRPSKTASPGGR
jgi:hypothetical protein